MNYSETANDVSPEEGDMEPQDFRASNYDEDDDEVADPHTEEQTIVTSAPANESLASLLVGMTEKVQDERAKRVEVEKRNHSLLMELDQLQKEVLSLRAASAATTDTRRVRETPAESSNGMINSTSDVDEGEFCWKELLDAKKAKEKALAEAHQRAMQVMELNACISMQHDELTALRTRAREDRETLERSEAAAKELRQERQLQAQEIKLLRDNVEHLTAEIGKRGTHFKTIMEKWTEAQAQSEHRERENAAMREQVQVARQRAELRERELETLRDERDALQHQTNQLKGAVAAKTAESKAFQTYGASAREHLQSQQAAMQRHAVYRRQVHGVARDAITSLRGMRATLAQTRAPLVAIQGDFRRFLERLRAPVMTLVERSSRYAKTAHAEHAPLRLALHSSELARRHLHEQIWRARRDALVVCQLQNGEAPLEADSDASHVLLRANYTNGELFLRERNSNTTSADTSDVVGVKCDAVLSDRAREWDRHESVTPVLQSVIDGYNACVTTFVGAPPLRIPGSNRQLSVQELLLHELFAAVAEHGSDSRFYRAKLTISFLAVFNETVFDLLGLEAASASTTDLNNSLTRQIVVLEVQSAEEALMVLTGGREHLTAATAQTFDLNGPRPMLTMWLTHTVVTICLSYENLLTGASPIKSKLQIVELALGSKARSAVQPSLPWSGEPNSHEEVKQRVAVENGAEALVTALAEVRVKDAAFVRYHSSKLTVLLQDTVKPGAKFLALVALSASPSDNSSKDYNPAIIMRALQQLRAAVSGGDNSRSTSRDRSLEGFMNRLALQQPQPGSDLALPFSSLGMQDLARHRAGSVMSWTGELEHMVKRYGKDIIESLSVPPPASQQLARGDSKCLENEDSLRCPAPIHPIAHASTSPPPAPAPTSGRKSKIIRKAKLPRFSTTTTTKPKKQAAGILMPSGRAVRSATLTHVPSPANATPAISSTAAPQSTLATVLKIRRETASSALKKTLLDKKLQDARTPFR